jgi:hypothetical protein
MFPEKQSSFRHAKDCQKLLLSEKNEKRSFFCQTNPAKELNDN